MFRLTPAVSPVSTFVLLLLLQCTFFSTVKSECVDVSTPRTRVFKDLVALQTNKIPFDPRQEDKFEGNYVAFNHTNLDTLHKNSFITLDSEHIQKLFLDSQNINTIEDGAFNSLTCLTSLDLHKNRIGEISRGTFLGLGFLHELDLGENNIKEVPERAFMSNTRLKKLNITRNSLKVLHPDSFLSLSRLEELDLSYNNLRVLHHDTFQYFGSLVNLQLGSNHLEYIELEKWSNVPKLRILNLSNNALESFDSTYHFNFSSSLTQLYLDRNLLTKVNHLGLRKNFPALKLVDLDDNPWACADLLRLLTVLNDSRIAYKGSYDSESNVGGIACNKSFAEYKRNKKLDDSVGSTTQVPVPVHVKDEELLSVSSTNMEILNSVNHLQTTMVCLFVVVVIFIVLDVAVRTGCINTVMNRRRHMTALDASDVENFSLLRERF